MSFPPAFLDELRNRLSIAQVVGRKVTWDARKSNQGKGDMWAPCPFHHEKTASFHVDDKKGYYYCFGCHAKGDAISFVRETENVGFSEAVEILAREVGLTIPARDPKAAEKQDRHARLVEVVELAVRWFRLQLQTAAGAQAREYLKGRGLDDAALAHWEIGFAPDRWQGLWDALKGKDIADELILEAGLAKPSAKGGKPYDTFRGRIMFPIRDARGRAIAFGGRAMDPNDAAKYLNSPETPLFDKGRTLFNVQGARAAAGKGQPLIVAEGYMDVIALHNAGFEAAVAPLGTAVTEDQLRLLWRISSEPIITMDGDTAGQRAALRLVDLALPLIEAGQSLRFAAMPEGQDPDDLIKLQGAPALQERLDSALPIVQLLWRRETEGKVFDSPERKAALDKDLRGQIQKIKDASLRTHYAQEIKDLRWELFRAKPSAHSRRQGSGSRSASAAPLQGTKSSVLAATTNDRAADHLREAVILAVFITYPDLIVEFENALDTMPCEDPDHAALRALLLQHGGAADSVLRENISTALGQDKLEKFLSQRHVSITPCIRAKRDFEMARMTVAGELAKLSAAHGLSAEISEAGEDLAGMADEGITWRLSEAARAAAEAQRLGHEDKTEYDIGDNGARINKEERSTFDQLLQSIHFRKPKGRP